MAFNKAKVLDDIQKYLQKGLVDKAIEEYERYLKIESKDYKNRQKLGDLYLRKGKTADAIKEYLNVADYYVKDGFYLKAIALYKQIIRIEPYKYDMYEKLSDLYKRQGLLVDAVAQLRVLADLYEKQKKLAEAMQTWEKIISADSDNVIYWGKLTEFYLKQGLTQRATEKLRQGLDYFKSKGRYEDVERLTTHFPGFVDEDASLGLKIAKTLFGSGKFKEAVEKIDGYLQMNPEDAEAFCLKAMAYFNTGQVVAAKQAFEKSLKINADSVDAKKGLLKVFLKLKDWIALIMLLELLFSQFMKNKTYDEAKVILDKYFIYLPEEKKLLKMYIELFRTTGEMTPLVENLKKMGALYIKEKKITEAEACFKEVLNLDPYEPTANAFFDEHKKQMKKSAEEKAHEDAAIIEDIELVEDEESKIHKDIDEVSYLLKYGLFAKAKTKLEELSARYADSLMLKEKWLDYFEAIKDTEAFQITINELIEGFQQKGDLAKTAAYDKKRQEFRERTGPPQTKEPQAETPAAASESVISDLDRGMPSIELPDFEEPVQEAAEQPAEKQPVPDAEFSESEFMPEAEPEAEFIPETEPETEAMPEAAPEEATASAVEEMPEGGGVSDMLLEAKVAFQDRQFDKAMELCSRILELDSGNIEADELITACSTAMFASQEEPSAVPEPRKQEDKGMEDFFDISSEIMKDFDEEESDQIQFKSEADRITFEELLKEFKTKVSSEIDEGDVETHFNLGIAYKEMGLFEDAVQEFILTSRFSNKAYDSYIMIAACLVEKNEMKKSIEFYKKALSMPDVPSEKKAGIYLEIGASYERLGELDMALTSFRTAFSTDASLQIAGDKVQEIEKKIASSASSGGARKN